MKYDDAIKRSRILIVEDELIVSADIASRLTRMGYEIVGQVDEAELALEQFAATKPDLLLMDIRLKGVIDGISLAEKIRSQSSVPIVFLTAHADDSTLQRAKITEPYGYILKPFEERELRIVVEIALYRSLADRQLAENRRFLSTVLGSIADVVLALDCDGQINYANSAAEKWLGQPANQLQGKQAAGVLALKDYTTDQPIDLEALLQANPNGVQSQEVLCAVQEGPNRRFLISIAQLASRGSTGSVLLLRDVTEQRKLEAIQWQAQRMEALGQLAAGIAHDLNNLLTVVCINSQLLLEMPLFDEPEIELLENITKAADRATKMTQQLLAIGRKRVSQPRIVDLNLIVSDYRSIIERIMSPGVYSLFELSSQPLELLIDPIQVEEILFNLVMHTRNSMADGGKLTIRTTKVDDCPEFSGKSAAVLEVIDTGLGFDESAQLRIWEPFSSNNQVGTELSLAAVYGIVQQSHAIVHLTSQVGKGSAFRILWQLQSKI